MKHEIKTLTADEAGKLVAERAERSGEQTVLMQENHRRDEDAWPLDELEDTANSYRDLVVRMDGDRDRIDNAVADDMQLVRFEVDHPVFAKKLRNVDFCNNPQAMQVIVDLFRIQNEFASGNITTEQARKRASSAALRAVLPASHPSQCELASSVSGGDRA